ncbi:MAG: 50S ribosomal protein L9 [Rhodospirillales bacterium]|nr:50S ribosomal protein L9 [Rhodospirillales bacterium]MCB9973181.1 50S ribosomal protein L9 [Rhodospirillales bacterium]
MGSTQVILLERVESLGNMGDTVNVKLGYARNYLLPQRKALRATKDNIAYFEAQKASLEAENKKKREAAEKESKKLEGLSLSIIRQSSEGGQLYGSVAARDIAEAATAESGVTIGRSQVELNQSFKTIGLFPVVIALHPEVKVEVTVNIARSAEEAAIQKKTGKAMVSAVEEEKEAAPAPASDAPAAAEESAEDAE